LTAVSYGKVEYQPPYWRISGEPFVKTRLRRHFPSIPQGPSDLISISATPENSRDLQWFLERFPMDVARRDLLESLAKQHVDTEMRLADLINGHIAPGQFEMAEPPRDYQAFASQMLEIKGGLLLADDLGLGKTVSAICSAVKPANMPVLIVCPAHLPRQWKKMFKRFAPHLTIHVLKKGTPYDLIPRTRGAQRELIPSSIPDVIISSYHKLRGWAETLKGLVRYVVYDECQQLRNPESDIYAASKLVGEGAALRMGLSATPIYNYGGEFFYVIDVLLPGALGTHSEFLTAWCKSGPNGKPMLKDSKEFGAYLRREGIMLRRTRKDVGRELPALSKIIHEIDADEEAFNELQGDAIELAKIVLKHNEQFRGEKMIAAGEFDAMMRQATGIAKAPFVAEFVRMLLDSGEPIILFGWHRAVYSIWMEKLKDFKPVLYTGSESEKEKDESIAAFLSGQSKLLIMSLRSGAGVDGLQGFCSTGVFGELDWAHGVQEQCMGRFHRDGQEEPCFAYFLMSETGTDPIMAEILGLKREQIEPVRNPDLALVEPIDTGATNIQRLARDYLSRRGAPLVDEQEDLVVDSMQMKSDELVDLL